MSINFNVANTERINTVNTTLLTRILPILSVVCLTTGPYPLPQRVLYRVRSSVSSFSGILSFP
jgi:hypothetical protein